MEHLKQIADKLPEYGLDAMLITSGPGERYAVDFHGEGMVVVSAGGSHYSTDGRYIEAAQGRIAGAERSLMTRERGHLALARAFLEGRGLRRVGFESGVMSVDEHRRAQETLGVELIPAQELLDGLRARGVLVRWWADEPIRDWLRVSIGTDEEMRALVGALKELI